MNNLGVGYRSIGRLDRALPYFQEAADGMEKRRFQHEYAERMIANLTDSHERLGEFNKAEVWRRKWLNSIKEKSGIDSPAYAGELAALGLNLLLQKKWTTADSDIRECLAIRQKSQPDVWTTFNTQSMLGAALLGQKKYAKAELLLVKGYEGLKAQAQVIPPAGATRILDALDRLIALSLATKKSDDIVKWRAERTKYGREPAPQKR